MALSRSLLPSNAGAGMVGPREILAGCNIGGDWIASSIPRPIKDLKIGLEIDSSIVRDVII